MRSSTIGSGRSMGSACSSTRMRRLAMRSSIRPLPYWPLLYSAMSEFARAATMPTRLLCAPAVGSGMPATGGGAGLSRPKPNSPFFFFSGAAAGGGLHSSTGGVPGSGMLIAAVRGSAPAGLPHGSVALVPPAGADQVRCEGAGATHASFSGAGVGADDCAGTGAAHEPWAGADGGGDPQGSSDVAGAGAALGGALQRSAETVGSGGVPQWSDPAAGGAQELAGVSTGGGACGSAGAGPKIPESALRRSSVSGAGCSARGVIQSGAGAGLSGVGAHWGATSEIGAAASPG